MVGQSSTRRSPEWPRINEMCDELSTNEGILRYCISIPLTLHDPQLADIHVGHLGNSKCQQMALGTIYWLGIDSNIEDYLKSYQIFIKAKPSLPIQSLFNHEVPPNTCQEVGADFFRWSGKCWPLVSDYFSTDCDYSPIHLCNGRNSDRGPHWQWSAIQQ